MTGEPCPRCLGIGQQLIGMTNGLIPTWIGCRNCKSSGQAQPHDLVREIESYLKRV